MTNPKTVVGIDVLLGGSLSELAAARLGLLCNQASVSGSLQHTRVLLQQRFGSGLTCLFSPQHGFHSEKQDNMIESDHATDHLTGLPIFSLYGDTRQPTDEMFAGIDVLLIDLVDVGTRVYTFLYTMAYCLETAARCGKKVIVLDRPNPIGGEDIEGNLLVPEYKSFVGRYPLPMRHGLTFAELALLINREYGIDAELEVAPMRGWKRSMYYRETGLPWVFPSPNMPTPETAIVYPGQVVWEGTNVSEGRGTTLPFELVGAPYWQHEPILDELSKQDFPGCFFRPLIFEPTSGKWAGEPCLGFQLHVTNNTSFKPYRTSLVLLQTIMTCYPEEFSYKPPPYEYEYLTLPMDCILGDQKVRKQLEQGIPVTDIEEGWLRDLQAFDDLRQDYFLY